MGGFLLFFFFYYMDLVVFEFEFEFELFGQMDFNIFIYVQFNLT